MKAAEYRLGVLRIRDEGYRMSQESAE